MMTMDQLEYGIVNYGTPLYVFDLDEVTKTVSEIQSKTNGIAQICFAMKANPFLAKKMAELTDRIEVCSAGEYEICRKQQIPTDKLLISGVLKERAELEKIIARCHDPEYKSWENESKIYEEKASQWLKEIRGKSA